MTGKTFNDFYQNFIPKTNLEKDIYRKVVFQTSLIAFILSLDFLFVNNLNFFVYFPFEEFLIFQSAIRLISLIVIIIISIKLSKEIFKGINVYENLSLENQIALITVTSLILTLVFNLLTSNVFGQYNNLENIFAMTVFQSTSIISIVFVTSKLVDSFFMINGFITKYSSKFPETYLLPIISGSMFYLLLTYLFQDFYLGGGGSYSFISTQYLFYSIFTIPVWIGTVGLFYYYFNQKIEYVGMVAYPNNIFKTWILFSLVFFISQIFLSILSPYRNFYILNLSGVFSSLEFGIYLILNLYSALVIYSVHRLKNKDIGTNYVFNNATS